MRFINKLDSIHRPNSAHGESESVNSAFLTSTNFRSIHFFFSNGFKQLNVYNSYIQLIDTQNERRSEMKKNQLRDMQFHQNKTIKIIHFTEKNEQNVKLFIQSCAKKRVHMYQ